MKALVVYESFWGNTAAIAHAIAEGIGGGAVALATDEATPDMVEQTDFLVVGAPVLGFTLPTDGMRKNISQGQAKAPAAPDLSHPSLRSWLAGLPAGCCRSAAFETRFKWSPGGAISAITHGLSRAGYAEAAKPERFMVGGSYGPLKDGELQRAREWGALLAREAAGGVSTV